MSQDKESQDKQADHLDQSDLSRAEKNSPIKAPIKGTEEDLQIDDTELTNPSAAAQESAKKNDPTAPRSPTA